MFTGLIEAVGRVGRIDSGLEGFRIRIEADIAPELSDGESVSVNGVCLTAAHRDSGGFTADIGPETARVTTLGALQPGQPVNLERAMRADARFGGHFVQGHVDGVGTIGRMRVEGDAHWLSVGFPAALAPFFVLKGSVAVDGVSLTVAALEADHFDVMIIPFTWTHTSLSSLQTGANVNLECDIVGKYVARAVQLIR
jgi:riboflavin synthase